MRRRGAKGQSMDSERFERVVGMTAEAVADYEWPSSAEPDQIEWPRAVPLRGSVRLASGRVVGRAEIARRWQAARARLLALLG